MVKVAVIGAGVIGLSTAYALKKRDPSVDVSIITKSLSPDTCTDVAAGIWLPYILRDTPMELQMYVNCSYHCSPCQCPVDIRH